jgi:fluoride exporter
MNISLVMLVGAGGFLGTIARFVAVQFIDSRISANFPWATLAVNLSGCFLIGLIYGLNANEAVLSRNWKFFLTTGFCGGYTTFSAFALENFVLLEQRMIPSSLLYIIISVVAGIASTFLGIFIGKWINP